MFAGLLGFMPGSPGASPLGLAVCILGVIAIVPAAFPGPGAALARRLLREPEPTSRYARLVARLVLVSLVVGLCGIAAYPQLYELLIESTEPLFETRNALGDIVGYVLVAFAAVGFLLRRDLGATLERLGLLHTRPLHLLVVPLGVMALLALNSGAEAIETRFFPALAEADRRMTEVIAGELGLAGALVLGLTAGIGEEITLRGALQPRLGIVLTALVFALYHVQYTWFGILVVFALGLVFGLIRRRTTTTVAIAVHAAYDVVVALSIGSG
jgi:membrane protease YdiL (CAAX protease family)